MMAIIAVRKTAEAFFIYMNAVDIVWHVNSSKKSLKQTSTFMNNQTESDW